MRSADTIWSWRWEGKDMTLVNLRLLPSLSRLAFTEPFDHVFDRPRHPEILLRDLVVLAIHDFLEAANRVGNHDVLAIKTSELLGNEEGLREELLNLPRARHRELVLLGKLVDPEDGDDVLQIFVALQNLFDGACHAIVLVAEDPGIENSRGRGERIDRGINSQFGNRPRKIRRGIQMRER